MWGRVHVTTFIAGQSMEFECLSVMQWKLFSSSITYKYTPLMVPALQVGDKGGGEEVKIKKPMASMDLAKNIPEVRSTLWCENST